MEIPSESSTEDRHLVGVARIHPRLAADIARRLKVSQSSQSYSPSQGYDALLETGVSGSQTLSPPSFNIADNKTAIILGNYRLGTVIRETKLGCVRLAKDAQDARFVLKIYRKENLKSKEIRQQVRQEILALQKCDHPHILHVWEVLETTAEVVIVTDLVHGEELTSCIASRGYVDEARAAIIFEQLLDAVSYSHYQQVVHGNISAENIVIDKDLNIILTGFRYAIVTSSMIPPREWFSSLPYAAPEALGATNYDGFMADIWSCGIVLYFILTGECPFQGNPTSLRKQILLGDITIPSYLSDDCIDLLSSILQIDPAKRIPVASIWKHPWMKTHLSAFSPSGSSPVTSETHSTGTSPIETRFPSTPGAASARLPRAASQSQLPLLSPSRHRRIMTLQPQFLLPFDRTVNLQHTTPSGHSTLSRDSHFSFETESSLTIEIPQMADGRVDSKMMPLSKSSSTLSLPHPSPANAFARRDQDSGVSHSDSKYRSITDRPVGANLSVAINNSPQSSPSLIPVTVIPPDPSALPPLSPAFALHRNDTVQVIPTVKTSRLDALTTDSSTCITQVGEGTNRKLTSSTANRIRSHSFVGIDSVLRSSTPNQNPKARVIVSTIAHPSCGVKHTEVVSSFGNMKKADSFPSLHKAYHERANLSGTTFASPAHQAASVRAIAGEGAMHARKVMKTASFRRSTSESGLLREQSRVSPTQFHGLQPVSEEQQRDDRRRVRTRQRANSDADVSGPSSSNANQLYKRFFRLTAEPGELLRLIRVSADPALRERTANVSFHAADTAFPSVSSNSVPLPALSQSLILPSVLEALQAESKSRIDGKQGEHSRVAEDTRAQAAESCSSYNTPIADQPPRIDHDVMNMVLFRENIAPDSAMGSPSSTPGGAPRDKQHRPKIFSAGVSDWERYTSLTALGNLRQNTSLRRRGLLKPDPPVRSPYIPSDSQISEPMKVTDNAESNGLLEGADENYFVGSVMIQQRSLHLVDGESVMSSQSNLISPSWSEISHSEVPDAFNAQLSPAQVGATHNQIIPSPSAHNATHRTKQSEDRTVGTDISDSMRKIKVLLFRAAEEGNTHEVRRLVTQEKGEPNAQGIDNWTALHFAARKGHVECVKELTALGANINALTRNQWSPLMMACDRGHIEVVRVLLDANADANILCNKDGATALMLAKRACDADPALKERCQTIVNLLHEFNHHNSA